MTRFRRHRACWPLLSTLQTLQSFYFDKSTANSLFGKILPVTPTRSRFCRQSFESTNCFQDFTTGAGEGGTAIFRSRPDSATGERYFTNQLTAAVQVVLIAEKALSSPWPSRPASKPVSWSSSSQSSWTWARRRYRPLPLSLVERHWPAPGGFSLAS